MRKIFFFFIPLFAFSFQMFSYDDIKKIAKEAEGIKIEEKRIKKNNSKLLKTKKNQKEINKVNLKESKKINLNKDRKFSKNFKINTSSSSLIIISKKSNKEIKIFNLPYLRKKDVIIEVIGSRNDFEDSLCKVKIGNVLKLEPCIDTIKFIKERNRLLDEFISKLYKFKEDVLRGKAYYRGYFNCGLLYRYYGFEHYEDCDKLVNMLTESEKYKLKKYIDFFLSH